MKQYEEHPEERDNLNVQLSSVDYQLEENEKFKDEEEENVALKIQSLENRGNDDKFVYEKWMDEILEEEVIDNYFDFSRALKLIQMEFKKKNVPNYEMFTELDLRSKWTEFELKKFRTDQDENFYHYTKEDLFPEDTQQKDEPIQQEEENKGMKIKIKEEKIDENALKTSTKKEDELAENEEIIDTCKPHKAKEDLQGLD